MCNGVTYGRKLLRVKPLRISLRCNLSPSVRGFSGNLCAQKGVGYCIKFSLCPVKFLLKMLHFDQFVKRFTRESFRIHQS